MHWPWMSWGSAKNASPENCWYSRGAGESANFKIQRLLKQNCPWLCFRKWILPAAVCIRRLDSLFVLRDWRVDSSRVFFRVCFNQLVNSYIFRSRKNRNWSRDHPQLTSGGRGDPRQKSPNSPEPPGYFLFNQFSGPIWWLKIIFWLGKLYYTVYNFFVSLHYSG